MGLINILINSLLCVDPYIVSHRFGMDKLIVHYKRLTTLFHNRRELIFNWRNWTEKQRPAPTHRTTVPTSDQTRSVTVKLRSWDNWALIKARWNRCVYFDYTCSRHFRSAHRFFQADFISQLTNSFPNFSFYSIRSQFGIHSVGDVWRGMFHHQRPVNLV